MRNTRFSRVVRLPVKVLSAAVLLCVLIHTTGANAEEKIPIIAGGAPADTCAFPSVVMAGGASGILVHPKVVLYTAHSGPAGTVVFGESGDGPTMFASESNTNPDHPVTDPMDPMIDKPEVVAQDFAYAVLDEPVTQIPYTPVAYGCELDEFATAGTRIVQVGFGLPNIGQKHWKENTIEIAEDGYIKTGGGVACPGDSGGAMFARMDDGSWRTIGILSTLNNEHLDLEEFDEWCGNDSSYNQYAMVTREMIEWVETDSGIDITPCFDIDGTWNPNEECGGFYAADVNVGEGTWDDWCEGTPEVAKSHTCEADEESDAGSDGDTDSDTDGDTDSDGDDADAESGNGDSGCRVINLSTAPTDTLLSILITVIR